MAKKMKWNDGEVLTRDLAESNKAAHTLAEEDKDKEVAIAIEMERLAEHLDDWSAREMVAWFKEQGMLYGYRNMGRAIGRTIFPLRKEKRHPASKAEIKKTLAGYAKMANGKRR